MVYERLKRRLYAHATTNNAKASQSVAQTTLASAR
jgi:hypothetical protein